MKQLSKLALSIGLALVLMSGTANAARSRLTLVELYTAQGCSACAAANDVMVSLAEKPEILTLTFSVSYWDYLGWKDSFSRPEFALRQKAYADRFDLPEVYTPQIVVNGRQQVAGGKVAAVLALVDKAARTAPGALDFERLSRSQVAVGTGAVPRTPADVWAISFVPGKTEVAIRRGDNRGKTLSFMNVAHQVERLGSWSGHSKIYRLPKAVLPGMRTVIVVQARSGGDVIGVGLLSDPTPLAPTPEPKP
jgi:hypothetical protein